MLNAIRLTTLALTLSMMPACASSQSTQSAKAAETHPAMMKSPHGHWMEGGRGTFTPTEAALHSLEEWARDSRKLDSRIRAFVDVLKSKPGDLDEVKRALQAMKAQSVRVQKSAKQALAQVEPFVHRAKRAGKIDADTRRVFSEYERARDIFKAAASRYDRVMKALKKVAKR